MSFQSNIQEQNNLKQPNLLQNETHNNTRMELIETKHKGVQEKKHRIRENFKEDHKEQREQRQNVLEQIHGAYQHSAEQSSSNGLWRLSHCHF